MAIQNVYPSDHETITGGTVTLDGIQTTGRLLIKDADAKVNGLKIKAVGGDHGAGIGSGGWVAVYSTADTQVVGDIAIEGGIILQIGAGTKDILLVPRFYLSGKALKLDKLLRFKTWTSDVPPEITTKQEKTNPKIRPRRDMGGT